MVGSSEEFLNLNLALKLHHTVEYGLRTRWAARDVDINGDNLINAFNDMIASLERTARDGASANCDYILRLGHFVVETFQRWSHLVGDGTSTHDKICLTWRVTRYLESETREVITCATYSHELDAAA